MRSALLLLLGIERGIKSLWLLNEIFLFHVLQTTYVLETSAGQRKMRSSNVQFDKKWDQVMIVNRLINGRSCYIRWKKAKKTILNIYVSCQCCPLKFEDEKCCRRIQWNKTRTWESKGEFWVLKPSQWVNEKETGDIWMHNPSGMAGF